MIGHPVVWSLALLLATTSCMSPPEWYMRRYPPPSHVENLDAIRQALEAREDAARGDAARSEPGSHENEPEAPRERPWYRVQPSAGLTAPFALPPARIVEPPARARRPLTTPRREQADFPIPPYTLVVPSPHPEIRCTPDLLGGQRCYTPP